ncbi:ATP-dependent endonuclease [Actinobacillus genomosp. 2]|uniref:DUF2813 domain-containing protein n=1 Tax=Actinobacillus genomosp. 2 TaxID=230709 RepID=UPI00244105F5|nr:DUF2813 domain-containing protein [Actinobacillus genomosp. 2]WGE31199.1 ATP-dependent endonuclease [Actinobacillus genomosp. 2]
MYLQQIEISGFRGINYLSLALHPNMVLIGENAWGKSSLLDALSHIFNLKDELYQFQEDDFHLKNQQQAQSIKLCFTFCEEESDASSQNELQYRDILHLTEEGLQKVYLQVIGILTEQGVQTTYQFLDSHGAVLNIDNLEQIVRIIINQTPVYRFRDVQLNPFANLAALSQPNNLTQHELSNELAALSLLLKYYFFNDDIHSVDTTLDTTQLWNQVKALCQHLKQNQDPKLIQQVRTQLSSLFVLNQKHKQIKTPIILFEDLEARLHPRMIAIFWELVSYLPIQRITTTNSMELLSQVPLREISRLVRYQDRTEAFSLTHSRLGKEDLRKLTFHIHYNRGLALFSRAWILVEGETEVWILTELANLLDINLEMEGIRIVEFAQCGLRPLIKYAKAMGIEWYVLTDGDQAGEKYADIAKSMLQEDEHPSKHLTVIPRQDIEHFFYHEGLREVFVRLARWQPRDHKYPTKTIIKRAIQYTSKPDLAIAISTEIKQRGNQAIPHLFKKLFIKVLQLIKEQ